MQTPTLCLPEDELRSFIAGELPEQRLLEVEAHLTSCDTCREALEATVGDRLWWNDLEQALGTTASLIGDNDIQCDQIAEDRSQLLDLLGPTDDPAMLGRIGGYEVVALLGQGGMGAVFKAFDRSLNRFVAIKLLLPHLASSGAARKRFSREAQAAAAVVDDHVMAIHGVSEWRSVPYFVMPYSRGVSLQKRLSDQGPLELREILRIGMQAARGLAAAHAQGLVHRDVKPANIFLDEGVERVQLMDFGLARAVDDASLTRSGTLAGTPQYMSPEQARAETVDHRSDLFSLGSVIYAMCTGHAPFRAESSYSVLRLITDKEPRPIREINPDVPEWLCSIISKLMAKKADERFASALEVAELLEDCLAHVQQPATARLPEVLVKKPKSRFTPLRFRKIGVYAMFAAVSSIVLSMLLMQPPENPQQEAVPAAAVQAEDVVTTQVFPVPTIHLEHSEPLFGVWTVEKIVSSGEVISPNKSPGEIEFRGTQMIWKHAGETAREDVVYEFDLDMSKSPHWLTFRSQDPQRPQPVLALLDVPGNQHARKDPGNPQGIDEQLPQIRIFSLRDANGNPSTQRPTEIGTGTEPGTDLIVLRLKPMSPESLSSLVMRSPRVVVEAYVAYALAGYIAQAAELAKDAPADPKRIKQFPELLNVQRLKIPTVYVNDPAKPTRALATSVAIKLDEEHKQPDGQRDVLLVFTLKLINEKWLVTDIDFESESGADDELKSFIKSNPNSIELAKNNDEQTIRNPLTVSDGVPVKPLLVRRLRIHGAVAVAEGEQQVAAGPEVYQVPGGPLLLVQAEHKSVLTEADILEVAAAANPNDHSSNDIVTMTLTEAAGKRFLKATTILSEQAGNGYMVITFDQKLLSAPRVLSPIGHKLSITGKIDAKGLVEQIQAAMDDVEAVELTPAVNVEDDDVAPLEELPQQE